MLLLHTKQYIGSKSPSLLILSLQRKAIYTRAIVDSFNNYSLGSYAFAGDRTRDFFAEGDLLLERECRDGRGECAVLFPL